MTTSTPVERRRARARLVLLSPRKRQISVYNFLACGAALISAQSASAQSSQSSPSFVLTTPDFQTIDSNHVSVMDGRVQVDLPLLKLGSVAYTEYNRTGITSTALNDLNYGYVTSCLNVYGSSGYAGSGECAVGSGAGVETVFGKDRAKFTYSSGHYVPARGDGQKYEDNDSTCTWTRSDGSQVVYAGYHASNSPVCESRNVLKVTYPDGRVADYFYYGALSTTTPNAIVSIAMNDGFMLHYVYSGTPVTGHQTSVIGINRAFQACDPSATTCSLAGAWPSATFTSQDKRVTVPDNYRSTGTGYDPSRHVVTTITDQEHMQHVFETDSYSRIVSYRPPGAEVPVFRYTLCTLAKDSNTRSTNVSWPLQDCFGRTSWRFDAPADSAPALLDLVSAVNKNDKVWQYNAQQNQDGTYPAYSRWKHSSSSPLGPYIGATGNSTIGMEGTAGPTDIVTGEDGTVYEFEKSVRNLLSHVTGPDGALTEFQYDGLANLTRVTRHPSTGSADALVRSASYPSDCSNLVTCHKPTSITDASLNKTEYTYDEKHGGVLTETGPSVKGVKPQKRYRYEQRFAWYLNASGAMIEDTRPIWVLSSESHCVTSASTENGCSKTNDEAVTYYDYGPDSGPNNLLIRGHTTTWAGQSRRTCFGQDQYGHRIWERSPNADLKSCSTY
jgi:YD repeat-containing protein